MGGFVAQASACVVSILPESNRTQAEQVAEKFQKCHSEGAVCPRIRFFLGIGEKADPSLRSG
jgi:hypothetical protein